MLAQIEQHLQSIPDVVQSAVLSRAMHSNNTLAVIIRYKSRDRCFYLFFNLPSVAETDAKMFVALTRPSVVPRAKPVT